MKSEEKIKLLKEVKGTFEEKELAFEMLKEAKLNPTYEAKDGWKNVTVTHFGDMVFVSSTMMIKEEK